VTSNRNIKFFDNYRIYHGCWFNKFSVFYDTVSPTVKSLELRATILLYYNPHERGTSRESKKKLNRSIVVKSLHSYHTTISLCQTIEGFGELNRSIVVMVVAQRAPLSVEPHGLIKHVKPWKLVKLVKKLRGVGLGVELWVSMLVNYIDSGLLHRVVLQMPVWVETELENMNNLLNLLNFSTTGW